LSTRDNHPDPIVTPEPLTRRNRSGVLYAREADVERQIVRAISLSGAALRERVAVSDRDSSDYLKEECLVYLLRYWRIRGDDQRVNDVTAALLRRVTPIIRKHLSSLGPQPLQEGHSEVVSRLFRPILDVTSDKADFLQVRFWVRVERLCIQVFGRQLAELKLGARQLSFSQVPGHDDDSYGGEVLQDGKRPRLTEADRQRLSTASPEDVITKAEDGREAQRLVLTLLEEPLRSTYLLRHLHGWPIEHQDPSVPTISRHFGKTPRTIRNWLAKAEQTLASRRENRNER
jgi:hypothetical protein